MNMKYFLTTLFLVAVMAGQSAMATMSATASLSPSTTTINHPVNVAISIINSGSSQLTVTNVKLTATSTQNPSSSRLPVAFSVFNQGPNASITIGPNATTIIPGGQVIFFSPSTGITGSGSGTYSVGATVYTSDGSVTPVSVAGVATINPIPLPAYERQ